MATLSKGHSFAGAETVTATKLNNLVDNATIANIVDADVSASAEIAVSKLADGTARQLLQTDAAGTGVEWASNIDVPGTLDVTGAAVFDSTLTVAGATTLNGNLTMGDADNMVFNTTTGTKIGTDATQKIGFWNATPAVQPAAVANLAVTFTANTPAAANGAITVADGNSPTVGELLEYCVELEAKLEDLLGKLRTIGIIAT